MNLQRGRKIAMSFHNAAAKYLERLREGNGKDLEAKERRLRLHLIRFLGSIPLSKISSFDVERYKKQRREEGGKVGTINRELAALSHLFTKAIEWRWIDKRPGLFPSTTSACGHAVRIREAFQRAVVAAGLNPDEIVPHTLRHTVITHLVQDGVDLPTVQRISGHKTLAMVAKVRPPKRSPYSGRHG